MFCFALVFYTYFPQNGVENILCSGSVWNFTWKFQIQYFSTSCHVLIRRNNMCVAPWVYRYISKYIWGFLIWKHFSVLNMLFYLKVFSFCAWSKSKHSLEKFSSHLWLRLWWLVRWAGGHRPRCCGRCSWCCGHCPPCCGHHGAAHLPPPVAAAGVSNTGILCSGLERNRLLQQENNARNISQSTRKIRFLGFWADGGRFQCSIRVPTSSATKKMPVPGL